MQRPYEDLLKGVPINPMMQLPGAHRRSQAQIVADNGGSMERPQFRGARPGQDRTKLVTQLQQQMEYGHALPEPPADGANSTAPPPPPPPKRSAEAALRDSIVAEIDERREFLEVMRHAGKTEHESAVQGQIAERLNDLKRLDALMTDG